MKLRNLILVAATMFATNAMAIKLQPDNEDAVKLGTAPAWNLKLGKSSNTVYALTAKDGTALGSANYGLLDIGGTVYRVNTPLSLTQNACTTAWNSSGTHPVYVYAAYGDSQGTSVSDASPSTDIHSGSDTTITIAVDKNPAVSVSFPTLTGMTTGAAIAAALQTAINSALVAAGQGGSVTVAYTTVYTITSNLKGNRSSVVVTAGSSLDVADDLKLGTGNSGVETVGVRGLSLCASDVGNKTTVGSTAVGNTGYMKCGITLPSATVVRELATASLNCTGPVIATPVESAILRGSQVHTVKAYGQASSSTAAAALVFAVRGLESGDKCVVTPVSWGTGPNYVKFAAVTANTLTVTVDTAQSGGSSVINYVCY